MSGDVLSLQARRQTLAFARDGWHVDLRLQSHNNSQMQNALLRLCVRNFRDQIVFEVSNVWRVQFVPTLEQDNKFHLRLFVNYENLEREAIVSDTNNFFLQETRLLSTSERLLVFDERHVLTSIPSWITNVGWQLLRYTDGNSFFWQAKQEPDPFEPQPEPPADQNYDISDLLAAAQPVDADKINGWECAICQEGIAGGRQLVAAHTATQNGTLHVYHRQCLEQWMDREQTCPTCRGPLDTKPLPAVWSAGNTKLNAYIAVNPYIVFNVGCVPGV
jgi:hypothetical protein